MTDETERPSRNERTASENFGGYWGRARTYAIAKVGDVLGGNLRVTKVLPRDAWGRRVAYECVHCHGMGETHDYMARRGHINCAGWAPEKKGLAWGLERALRWARQQMGDTRELHVRALTKRGSYRP